MTRKKRAKKETPISSATTGTVTIDVEPSVAQAIEEQRKKKELVKEYLLESFAALLDDIL